MTISNLLTPLDYETRNLGIQSWGVSENFISNPDIKLLEHTIKDIEKKISLFFMQARINSDAIPLQIALQKIGFYCIEVTLTPHTVLNKNRPFQNFKNSKHNFIPKRLTVDDIEVTIVDKSDLQLMDKLKKIAQDSFTKDRFHRDPNCPDILADNRYKFWVEDMIKNETEFDALYYKKEMAGFMARCGNHLLLAGFTPKFAASGLGDYLWFSSLEILEKGGITSVQTQISASNLPVLNLYMRLGFKFKETSTILHYWSKSS